MTKTMRGVIRGGAVILESSAQLPDGTAVEVIVCDNIAPAIEIPEELREEFAAWEQLSDEAWSKFLEWEKETSGNVHSL